MNKTGKVRYAIVGLSHIMNRDPARVRSCRREQRSSRHSSPEPEKLEGVSQVRKPAVYS